MAINHIVLQNDILGRPELDAKRAVGDDVGIAGFYNTPMSGVTSNLVTITNEQVLKWSATGPYTKLLDAVNSSGVLTHGVRSRAAVLLRLVDSFTSIDVSSNAMSGVISNLATNGVVTTTERDNFLELGVKTDSTLGEALFGPNTKISIDDISKALRGS